MMPVMAARIVPMMVTPSASAAGHALQQHLDAVEQIVGDAASLHDDAHEDEGRDRDQHQILRRLAPDARHEIEELDQPEGAEEVADQAEGQRHAAQHERHRVAREQQGGQRQEHHDRQVVLRKVEQFLAGVLWQRCDDARRPPQPEQGSAASPTCRRATGRARVCSVYAILHLERREMAEHRDRARLGPVLLHDAMVWRTHAARLTISGRSASRPGRRPRSRTSCGSRGSGRRPS